MRDSQYRTTRRRQAAAVLALAMVAAACTGDGGVPTTEALLDSSTTTAPPPQSTSTTVAASEAPTTTGFTETVEIRPLDFKLDFRPVLGPGGTEWDSNYVVPGALIVDDGLLYMFYNGSDLQGTAVTRSAVGFATSDDGKFFGRATEEPLFDGADQPWTDAGVVVSSVVVLDDGTWALYFHTVSRTFSQRGGLIGRATAPRPEGPWTVDDAPLLELGAEGEWDGSGLSHPSVLRGPGGGYLMYYDAHIRDEDVVPDRFIGMATSPDGAVWTKFDDPATTEAPFANSDPVLGVGEPETWDALRVEHPSVIATDDGYAMVYMSNHKGAQPGLVWEFGVATSTDGLEWDRLESNPFWTTRNLFGFITSSSFIEFDDRWIVMVDGAGNVASPSNGIFLLTSPIPGIG